MCMTQNEWRVLRRSMCQLFDHGPLQGDGVHGPDHWQRVHDRGVLLAAGTEGADIAVVKAFAWIHDSQRVNDWADPDHGPRAASVVRAMASNGSLRLWPEQVDVLVVAIRDHDLGQTTTDPTIGCCWDADRLDLGRVGKWPDPGLLSTTLGKAAAYYV